MKYSFSLSSGGEKCSAFLEDLLLKRKEEVKINHLFIWASAQAEQLIEANTSENSYLDMSTVKQLLDQLALCLTYETSFREAKEAFYYMKQSLKEDTTPYFSRIVISLPMDGQRKLMEQGKEVKVRECLVIIHRCEAVDATMKLVGDQRSQYPNYVPVTQGIPLEDSNEMEIKEKFHQRTDIPAKDAVCRNCNKNVETKSFKHIDKVDTGALVLCMSISILKSIRLSQEKLSASKIKLFGFSGQYLNNLRFIDIMAPSNRKQLNDIFNINKSGQKILQGIKFCKQFELVNYAPSCGLSKVTAEQSPQWDNAVHIMNESDKNSRSYIANKRDISLKGEKRGCCQGLKD
ncbi:unnamed protein product [Lepeophtheirus salmonis]|uniref:(salmon louse) hypothetical protein n=1 Tax=Lepeophtheirus salmonis TaxID=72036 RepID=A0A7R8D6E7_LEPSM|nr:unnamed protein product [Lepeophtheirus salmonis]CAF3043037.1 unnamed protein product [Lepeophtheirus salmonis]